VRKTVESLQVNDLAKESDLFIFSDGAKYGEDQESVDEVRRYIYGIGSFRRVEIVESPVNKGLSSSIVSGITSVIAQYGKIIVLEDDMVTSPYFLLFMNEALQRYGTEEKVISIHGYSFPTKETLPETFFLRGADCWGWATWERGWDLFEPDGAVLFSQLSKQNLVKRFDMYGAFPYTQMLRNQVAAKIDSWAIRWHASAFLAGKLTLYPGKSLVRNIGTDSSGTHCSKSGCFDCPLSDQPVPVKKIDVIESILALEAFGRFLKSVGNKGIKDQISHIFKSIARRIYVEKH
jgi:hypothetical protein